MMHHEEIRFWELIKEVVWNYLWFDTAWIIFFVQGGHGSPLVLKSYFTRDIFSVFDINRYYHFFCEITQLLWIINSKSSLKGCNFIKKVIPTPMFSCEYFKNFRNSFFYGTPPVSIFTFSQHFFIFFLPFLYIFFSTQ